MTKRKYDAIQEEHSPIKRMCNNGNLIRVRPEPSWINMLRQGSRRFWSSLRDQEAGQTRVEQVKCKVCDRLTPDEDDDMNYVPVKCNFCEQMVCFNCLVVCGRCENSFCTFCAVRVYDSSATAGVCLSCIR
ncbi:uncharacterized protein LOC141852026 [Brevipalpus obovatus]|uniref:uncharacterized protein LOC141852026 n=1 Tax=Brevipalpus obovatus TaxID=246614 RepID=UPI003D9EFABD